MSLYLRTDMYCSGTGKQQPRAKIGFASVKMAGGPDGWPTKVVACRRAFHALSHLRPLCPLVTEDVPTGWTGRRTRSSTLVRVHPWRCHWCTCLYPIWYRYTIGSSPGWCLPVIPQVLSTTEEVKPASTRACQPAEVIHRWWCRGAASSIIGSCWLNFLSLFAGAGVFRQGPRREGGENCKIVLCRNLIVF